MSRFLKFRTPQILIAIISAAVCFLLYSCLKNPRTIWSEEVRSPDGLWLAVAHTDRYSGPGNAGLYTAVDLKHLRGRKGTAQILLFDFQDEIPSKATVKMNWSSPTQLNVAYSGNAAIDLQVVKYGGVEIFLRDLSNNANIKQSE